jgi:hypothetical protein
MQTLSPLGARGKSEPFATSSSGIAGSRRRWAIEARGCGSDWRTLIDCAEAVLSRLRIAHGVSSSS